MWYEWKKRTPKSVAKTNIYIHVKINSLANDGELQTSKWRGEKNFSIRSVGECFGIKQIILIKRGCENTSCVL